MINIETFLNWIKLVVFLHLWVGCELYWAWAPILIGDCSKICCSWNITLRWRLWTFSSNIELRYSNSRRLDHTNFWHFISSMHHLFKYLLLTWFSISLILLTNNPIFWVPKSKEISFGIKSSVRYWMIRASSFSILLELLNRSTIRFSLSLSLDYRCILSDGVNAFRLIAIVVEKWHMSCKLLLRLMVNGAVSCVFLVSHSFSVVLNLLLKLGFIFRNLIWHTTLKLWRCIEMWPIWFSIFLILNFPMATFLLSEIRLSYIEVLVLQLFNSTLKCPIFVSELYELCIYFIHSCDSWCNILEIPSLSKFSIFRIAFFHNALYLLRYKFIIVMAIILQNAFNKF